MSAYEPRAIKGTGVTYATSPQGADHTAGLTIRFKLNHLDPTVQKEASLNPAEGGRLRHSGVCIFAASGYAATPDNVVRRLLQARYGWQDVPENVLQELGKQTIKMEREFNRRAGFTAKDDRLPEWMTRQPLPPHDAVFDVPDEALDSIFDGIE
jgi:aldehyde:ferredoxin oxidoreductase